MLTRADNSCPSLQDEKALGIRSDARRLVSIQNVDLLYPSDCVQWFVRMTSGALMS
jgi:hypothetical protein